MRIQPQQASSRLNPSRDSGCAAANDQLSKIILADDRDEVTDSLHVFRYLMLAASNMSGKNGQILIPGDEAGGLLGYARLDQNPAQAATSAASVRDGPSAPVKITVEPANSPDGFPSMGIAGA
ncbi:hypothetical protein [Paracoccus sp. (in: a-proteobacteria)]|uniref:hypothetical protein n=1 Tax=Paracoccus sp. TaxID=267 RepID=UPI00396CEF5A